MMMTKNTALSKHATKYVNFLKTNAHTVDLINYLHDLNKQLKSGKKLQHNIFESEDDYYPYFKTNIDKVRCRKTYRFKKSEFQYYNFGLMLGNESAKNSDDYYLFEEGSIIVEPDTNTVLLQYSISNELLLIKENNYQLQFFTRPWPEYIEYLKNKDERKIVENYMIEHLEPEEEY